MDEEPVATVGVPQKSGELPSKAEIVESGWDRHQRRLRGMAEKSEADGKAEAETFDKFQCHSTNLGAASHGDHGCGGHDGVNGMLGEAQSSSLSPLRQHRSTRGGP